VWPTSAATGEVHADNAYDTELGRWVRERSIGVRIARKGVEPSNRLGLHRGVIERTISRLAGYHRLNLRSDRKATHLIGFLTLAAALSGDRKLAKAKTTTRDIH
jgi:hypothetical protein